MAMVLGEFGTWRNSTIGNRLNGRSSDRLFRKTGLSENNSAVRWLSLQTSEHDGSSVGGSGMIVGADKKRYRLGWRQYGYMSITLAFTRRTMVDGR